MERIRIATLFNRLNIGGDENRVLNYARSYDRDRFDYRMVVLVRPTKEQEDAAGPMLARFEEHGILVDFLDETARLTYRRLPFPLSTLRDLGAFGRVGLRLVRYFRRHRIDVLDTRGVNTIALGSLAARLAGVPVILATEYFLDNWKSGFGPFLRRHLFRFVDALVTDSHTRTRDFRAYFPRSDGRVYMVPNGIFPPQTALSRAEARTRMGVPDHPDTVVLGQVSRLIKYKGHEVLLQAAPRILEQVPGAFFIICGFAARFSDYEEQLNRMAAELGLADRVRIGGYPGPIADVWAAVDLHVHATVYDSSPIAIHETMALGLPAVASATGDIPDLIEDGRTGLLVPPGDAEALADAVIRVLTEDGLAARLGAAARLRYEANHRPEIMARGLERIMLEILGKKRGPQRL